MYQYRVTGRVTILRIVLGLDVGVYAKELPDQLLAGATDCDRPLSNIWPQSQPEALRGYRLKRRPNASNSRPPAVWPPVVTSGVPLHTAQHHMGPMCFR